MKRKPAEESRANNRLCFVQRCLNQAQCHLHSRRNKALVLTMTALHCGPKFDDTLSYEFCSVLNQCLPDPQSPFYEEHLYRQFLGSISAAHPGTAHLPLEETAVFSVR